MAGKTLGYVSGQYSQLAYIPSTPKPVVEGKEYAWFEPNRVWIELQKEDN